ncbi:NADH-ubiquinone oxidoreductase-like protein, partial [Lophium mytilinum]
MLSLRRSALTSARIARAPVARLRRSAHHDAHHDAHHGPVNESFGPKFYIGIAAIPALLGLYYASRSSDDDRPLLYRYIDSYSEYKTLWAERNDIHTKALERAGADRNLFIHSKGQQTVDLKFPEQFNFGSPYNVPAGSSVNLDKLIAKYEKENYGAQEAKLQALKDGSLPAEREEK